ncbi:MAG: hypothetical protein DMF62_03195 [Acidobacteria bacterium]|nr:MAG: hypothetical protein DMF62_03195 [Acidobacteriota bacterium]PYT00179.1 MAG: hypothetical protein DMF63_08350 [Acidobacteriota bacterium]
MNQTTLVLIIGAAVLLFVASFYLWRRKPPEPPLK